MEALGLSFQEAPPLPYIARWFAADGVVIVTGTIASVYPIEQLPPAAFKRTLPIGQLMTPAQPRA